eukprot:PLAT11822.1.p1 GENE.PLAT11822.1~~PLAT11822.1.p1  ORF type:complete len:206 (+),score=64.28 PLAT11822.1:1024-1641(+)
MKVHSIAIVYGDKVLDSAMDLSSLYFWQRKAAAEVGRLLLSEAASKGAEGGGTFIGVDMTLPGEEKEDEGLAAVYCSGGLTTVVVVDEEYPRRVAMTLAMDLCGQYSTAYSREEWEAAEGDNSLRLEALEEIFASAQSPEAVDKISAIHSELEATKLVVHRTIGRLIERQEDLDRLVERSAKLSESSKKMYTTARRMNRRCCVLL